MSSSGKVTAVANGNTTITATAADGSGKKDICAVTVNIPKPADPTPTPDPTPSVVKVSSVSLNQSSLNLTQKGQTARLSATVSPSNATNKSINWSSSNNNVATVSKWGSHCSWKRQRNDHRNRSRWLRKEGKLQRNGEHSDSTRHGKSKHCGGESKICSIYFDEIRQASILPILSSHLKATIASIRLTDTNIQHNWKHLRTGDRLKIRNLPGKSCQRQSSASHLGNQCNLQLVRIHQIRKLEERRGSPDLDKRNVCDRKAGHSVQLHSHQLELWFHVQQTLCHGL